MGEGEPGRPEAHATCQVEFLLGIAKSCFCSYAVASVPWVSEVEGCKAAGGLDAPE